MTHCPLPTAEMMLTTEIGWLKKTKVSFISKIRVRPLLEISWNCCGIHYSPSYCCRYCCFTLNRLKFNARWFDSSESSPKTLFSVVSRKSRNFSCAFRLTNSLCIFKTMASRGTKLCRYLNYYSLYNIWKTSFTEIVGRSLKNDFSGPKVFRDFRETGPRYFLLIIC